VIVCASRNGINLANLWASGSQFTAAQNPRRNTHGIDAFYDHCLRIGPRFNATCTSIITSDGHNRPWVSEMRYLGIYTVNHKNVQFIFDYNFG